MADFFPSCIANQNILEQLLPNKCRYCTRYFKNINTYLRHIKSHQLKYYKFWYVNPKRRSLMNRKTRQLNLPTRDEGLKYMYFDETDKEILIYQYKGKEFKKLCNYKVFEKVPSVRKNLPRQYMLPPYRSKGLREAAKKMGLKHQCKGGLKIVKPYVKKVGKYVCVTCSKSFHKAYALELHENSHSVKTSTGKKTGAYALELHERENSHSVKTSARKNSVSKFPCKVCSKVFQKADILELHERSHTFKTPDKMFTTNENHQRITKVAKIVVQSLKDSVQPDGTFKCKHCMQICTDHHEWELHERAHTLKNSNQKVLTLKIRETVQAFSESVKIKQEDQKPVQSKIVDIKPPTNIPLLKNHKTQMDDKELLLQSLSLRRKVTTEHSRLQMVTKQLEQQLKKNLLRAFPIIQPIPKLRQEGGQLLPCRFCSMLFATVSELAQHNRGCRGHKKTLTSKHKFQCGLCDKYFTQGGSLRAHERIHTGERPYSCNVCGKSFHESGKLRRHERTHTGEKRYECSWCGRRFAQNGTRKSHEKTHIGMPRFGIMSGMK